MCMWIENSRYHSFFCMARELVDFVVWVPLSCRPAGENSLCIPHVEVIICGYGEHKITLKFQNVKKLNTLILFHNAIRFN